MDTFTSVATWLQATGPYGLYVTWNQLSTSRSKETDGWQQQGDPVGAFPPCEGSR